MTNAAMNVRKHNMNIHAQTAKAIRLELKKDFPGIKFSVTSQSYSGGNSVAIEWIDGPTSEQVGKVVYKYQYGHFNGMEDIYENTNNRNDIPQVKYVQVRRNVCEKTMQEVFQLLQKTHSYFDEVSSMDEVNDNIKKHWDCWVAREYIYRLLSNVELTDELLESYRKNGLNPSAQ